MNALGESDDVRIRERKPSGVVLASGADAGDVAVRGDGGGCEEGGGESSERN